MSPTIGVCLKSTVAHQMNEERGKSQSRLDYMRVSACVQECLCAELVGA